MKPEVTIVVVPRERFAKAVESLESIYALTEYPFELVYVNSGGPEWLTRHLEKEASRRGFRLVSVDRILSPNEARNVGMMEVQTKYVVFADNDLIVTKGWLAPLVRCAEETGAEVVGPLYFEGNPEDCILHTAGGFNYIDRRRGRDTLRLVHRFGSTPLRDVPEPLYRQKCTDMEFHLMMVRTDVMRRLGPLDEGLLAMHEHLDLCYLVLGTGGSVYFEPASVVTHTFPPPWQTSDLPFFIVRWSDTWNLASVRHFDEKWGVDSEDVVQPWIEWRRRRFLTGVGAPEHMDLPATPLEDAGLLIAMLQAFGMEYFDVSILRGDVLVRSMPQVDAGALVLSLQSLFGEAEADGLQIVVRPVPEAPRLRTDPPQFPEVGAGGLTASQRFERIRTFLSVVESDKDPRVPQGDFVKPILVVVDDVDPAQLERLGSLAFMTVEVAPERHQCWLAFDSDDRASVIDSCRELLAERGGRLLEYPAGILAGSPGVPREGRVHRSRIISAMGGRLVEFEEGSGSFHTTTLRDD